MKNAIKVLLISLVALVSTTASATTITGTLIMGGAYQPTSGGFSVTDLSTATDIGLDTVWANNTPDFDPTINPFTAASGGSLSLTSLASVPGFFTVGAWTFDLKEFSIDKVLSDTLILTGTGFLYKDIADQHAVTWSFSSEGLVSSTTGLGSYSMSVTAVPVPAAVWLFGSGLIGLVGVARRKL